MRAVSIRIFALLVAVLAGHGSAASQPAELVRGDSGGRLVVRRGSGIVVTLPAQLGTGHSWQSVENPLVRLDASGLGGRSGKPGGSQEQVFHYTAVATGTTSLVLLYRQPWHDAPPLDRFEVVLHIVR